MAKKDDNKGIQKVNPQGGALVTAPSHIQRGREAAGRERLAEFVKPPLLKIVQKQSDDSILDTFGKGTTLITPANVVVSNVGEYFHIVPIMQYAEYITWAPIELKGQVPAILDRTTDNNSPLAAKCRNRDKWFEHGYKFGDRVIGTGESGPESKPVRHVEHITFIVVLEGEEFGKIPCVMSFSRGSHKFGRNFASLLQMRNADVYGCRFEVKVPEEPQKNEKGTWYVWEVTNPSEESGISPWVTDEAEYNMYRSLANDMEEAYQNNLLRPDFEDPDEREAEPARDDM